MEEFIAIIKKWRNPILFACLAAIVVSSVIALLLPEYFSSQATFIPANPHIMDRSNVFGNKGGDETVYLFGGSNDVNRLMSLMLSNSVEEYLIEKFNLYEHYDIDNDDPQKIYWVKQAIREYIQLGRTPEGMLQVKVLDKNPQFAALIANDIVSRLDTLNRIIVNEKKRNLEKLYEREATNKRREFDLLKDSLLNIVKNNPKDTVMAKILKDVVKNTMTEYIGMKNLYEQHASALNEDFSTLYILELAEPAVKRTKPVRAYIVVTSLLATLITMLIAAVFIERYQNLFTQK